MSKLWLLDLEVVLEEGAFLLNMFCDKPTMAAAANPPLRANFLARLVSAPFRPDASGASPCAFVPLSPRDHTSRPGYVRDNQDKRRRFPTGGCS